jgi:hypothetical protein
MRLPTTPANLKVRDLQTQIDDLGRAHHATAMTVAELGRILETQDKIDLRSALSAALDLIVSLQEELADTRHRLFAQESRTGDTAAALEELAQQHAALSRIVEGQFSAPAERVHGAEQA